MDRKKLSIPPELENILLEYTINAIVTQPEDYIRHAADYFNRLRDRNTLPPPDNTEASEGSKEHIRSVLRNKGKRRTTVVGENYNPEEDNDDNGVKMNPKSDEERDRIKSKAADIFLFRVLDDSDLAAVIDAMVPVNVEKGQTIMQQGDDGDYFYLVDKGTYDARKEGPDGVERIVCQYNDGGYFGELALLHNQPREATIDATSDGSLWAVSRKTFNKLIVKRAFQKREMYMQLLERVSLLEPLTDYERMQVADALCAKSFSEGDIIVEEGDEGDGMYFIVEGKVSVRQKQDTGDVKEISQLGEGKFFGELALLKKQPRDATVVALEDTKTAFLDVKAFERLLGPCMDIMNRHAETYRRTSKSQRRRSKSSSKTKTSDA